MDNGLLHECREKINEGYMILHIFRNKNSKNRWSVLCSAIDWDVLCFCTNIYEIGTKKQAFTR